MNRLLSSPALPLAAALLVALSLPSYGQPPKAKNGKGKTPYDKKIDGDRELHEIAQKLIAEHQLPGMKIWSR